MAAADLRDELFCSICLQTYTDPVMLQCGHNYCRDCIGCFFDTQKESGVYSCPECREVFMDRPALMKNYALRKIMENLQLTERGQEQDTGIFCTYCIHSPVPAVRSCLLCEASLCEDHLRVHSKSPEHVLCTPSAYLEKRKCSVHKKILEYYCTEDAASICVACSLAGEHQGHRIENLDKAFVKKKERLRTFLQKLTTKRKETEQRVQSLEERMGKSQEKAAGEVERVTALFKDVRRHLDDLEEKVLGEMSMKEMAEVLSFSALMQQLEKRKEELSRNIKHVEDLCNMTDPLTFLQGPDTGDFCDPEESEVDKGTGGHKKPHDVDDLYVTVIQDLVDTLCEIIPSTRIGIYVEGPANILLDVNTAANNILISHDLKTVTWTQRNQHRPERAERFNVRQVMSSKGFSSGSHYWDVYISDSEVWRMGMCYPSIDRKFGQPIIGYNNKSWSLRLFEDQYSVMHDGDEIILPNYVSNDRIRICLDYEAGQLSFYELCDPMKHLYTFFATFTEPLHAVLWIGVGSLKISD